MVDGLLCLECLDLIKWAYTPWLWTVFISQPLERVFVPAYPGERGAIGAELWMWATCGHDSKIERQVTRG